MIIRIRGKRYKWNPAKMHAAILWPLYITGVFAAALGAWALVAVIITMGGTVC